MLIGTYQIRFDRLKCHDSHIRWQVGDGYMAGNLVLGISSAEAYKKSYCYGSRREDVKLLEFSLGGLYQGKMNSWLIVMCLIITN